jgi:hypothetical protein
MVAAPKPASAKPAVVIAVAAAKRLMFFTSAFLPCGSASEHPPWT